MTITPVILCGGVGTRLWPLSREQFPKQFQNLLGEESLFQQTVLRALSVTDGAPPLVICHQEHRFIVAEQLRLIHCEHAQILLEPKGRNTAPAMLMAALYAQQNETVLWVMPADHYMSGNDILKIAVQHGKSQAEEGYLVTLGVKPSRIETAYGYIQTGDPLNAGAFAVATFIEKPDRLHAEQYVKQGGYLWNSGMFMFTPHTLLQEAQHYVPDMLTACVNLLNAIRHEQDFAWLPADFAEVPANSIDYAVMEKTQKACVVPLTCGWDDVGSWDALSKIKQSNDQHNQFAGDVTALNVENTAIYSNSRLVTAIGVRDQIIVETPDAVLVVHKNHVQAVKELVAQLSADKRPEVVHHKRVYRPWGWYESLASSTGFQVKRIFVKPHATLSLQSHQHRAEHWVIVKGQAEVTNNETVFLLNSNQSTYIPAGSKHRLANRSDAPLELIEVQSGEYLGEDDIVRFEDHYGRT